MKKVKKIKKLVLEGFVGAIFISAISTSVSAAENPKLSLGLTLNDSGKKYESKEIIKGETFTLKANPENGFSRNGKNAYSAATLELSFDENSSVCNKIEDIKTLDIKVKKILFDDDDVTAESKEYNLDDLKDGININSLIDDDGWKNSDNGEFKTISTFSVEVEIVDFDTNNKKEDKKEDKPKKIVHKKKVVEDKSNKNPNSGVKENTLAVWSGIVLSIGMASVTFKKK